MINVLVYPNITFARNLEADSYVVALGQILRHMERDDLRFTLMLPQPVASLELPNVEQVVYDLPTYPNTMRCHFDTAKFLDVVDWKNRSWDIVWSHLPEHTAAIHNVFTNVTNERPVIVGYSHWFEVPENTSYGATMLLHNFAGILSMRTCGVNSEWLRDLVLRYGDELLGHDSADALRGIVQVQYLGSQRTDVTAPVEPGLIVFNHRANEYTGFNDAVQMFDTLWEQRQDFRVWFTQGPPTGRPWLAPAVDTTSRDAYMRRLASAYVGIGMFKRYSAWSVSVMDGMSVGVPYVLPNRLCYPEMMGADAPALYGNRNEAIQLLNAVLDDPILRDAWSAHASAVARSYDWEIRAQTFRAMFDDAIDALPMLKNETESYARVARLAAAGATKSDIMRLEGWGVRVPWSQYRNRLRADGIEIRDTPEQLALV